MNIDLMTAVGMARKYNVDKANGSGRIVKKDFVQWCVDELQQTEEWAQKTFDRVTSSGAASLDKKGEVAYLLSKIKFLDKYNRGEIA